MDIDDSPYYRHNSNEPLKKQMKGMDTATENPDGGDQSCFKDKLDQSEKAVRNFRALEADNSQKDVD
jgi:hypothetical protein